MMIDDDIPPFSLPIRQPTDLRWRSNPPTINEVSTWPYWWYRVPCCQPDLLVLHVEGDQVIDQDGEPFNPAEYPGDQAIYTAAVPPQ